MKKVNQILILALAAQAVVIMGMRLSDKPRLAVQSVKVLDPFDPEKVTRIKISGPPAEKEGDPPQNQIELSREGTVWGIASADGYPAEQTKVEEFLRNLSKLRSRNTVLTQSTFHNRLEVAADRFQREITLTHEGQPVKLFLGSSPSFKNVHVRLDGRDEVYLVSDFATSDAADRAWSWVERAYLQVPKEQVWGLRIENTHGLIELERDPSTSLWNLAGAGSGPLDTSAVDNLVSKASTVNLDAPLGKLEKPEYGLGAVTVTLVTGTSTITGTPPPSTETTVLRIGRKMEKENTYPVKSSRSDFVVSVAGWAVEPLLEKAAKDLLAKAATDAAPPPAPARGRGSKAPSRP